jgi:hypothetical protein
MSKVGTVADELKRDVREVAAISMEDKISKDKIDFYRRLDRNRLKPEIECDPITSDITGINQVCKRFADKLGSMITKRKREEPRLILDCIYLIVKDVTEEKSR